MIQVIDFSIIVTKYGTLQELHHFIACEEVMLMKLALRVSVYIYI